MANSDGVLIAYHNNCANLPKADLEKKKEAINVQIRAMDKKVIALKAKDEKLDRSDEELVKHLGAQLGILNQILATK